MNLKQFLNARLAALCVAIFLYACSLHPARAQDKPAAKPAVGKEARVLVGRFSRPLGRYSPQNWPEWQQRLQETLSEKLNDNQISVVERERLKEVTDELLRAGDAVDAEQALQIGHLSGATHLLVGRTTFEINKNFLTYEYVFVLKARMISLRTGKVITTFEARGKKNGKYINNQDEAEHFLESTMDQACAELAKKVAASPPPPEEAEVVRSSDEPGDQSSGQGGSIVVEGDGRANVQNGDEQAAKGAAREEAVREAVLRMGKMLTRSDSQPDTQRLIDADPSRYAVAEGEPLSSSVRDGVCNTTVHVRVFLSHAPDGKLALVNRLRDRGLLTMPRVMVIVPETMLARPRIPDPAVETEIIRQVQNAGFQVVDAAQTAKIRDQDWIRALATQTATPDELSRLKADYGADILITGEAISQRAEADRIGNAIRCAARAEIKAFRVDNAEMIFSDAVPNEQATGIAEAIVAKSALQNAGKRIAPRIVDKLFARGFGSVTAGPAVGSQVIGTAMNIKISGWERTGDISAFLKALVKVKGVIKVADQTIEAGVLNVKLLVDPSSAATFGFDMPDDPAMKMFHLSITTFKGTTIDGKVASGGFRRRE